MREQVKKRDLGKKLPPTNGNHSYKGSSQNKPPPASKPNVAPEIAHQKISELEKANSTANASKISAKSPQSVKPPERSPERIRRKSKSHKSGTPSPKSTENQNVTSETKNEDPSIQDVQNLEIVKKLIKHIEENITEAKQKNRQSTMSDSPAQTISPSTHGTNKSLPGSPSRVDSAAGIPNKRGPALDSGTRRSPDTTDSQSKRSHKETVQYSGENPVELVRSTSDRSNQLSQAIVMSKASTRPSHPQSKNTNPGKRDRIGDEKTSSLNPGLSSGNIDTKVFPDQTDSSGGSPRKMIREEIDESEKRIQQIERQMTKIKYQKRIKKLDRKIELAKKSRPKFPKNEEEKHKAKYSGHKQQHMKSPKERRGAESSDCESSGSEISFDEYLDDSDDARRKERLVDRLPQTYRDAVQTSSPSGRLESRTDVTDARGRNPDSHSSLGKDVERINYKSRPSSRDRFNPDSSPISRSSPRDVGQISRHGHSERKHHISQRDRSRSRSGDSVKRKRRSSSPDSSHRRHEPNYHPSKRRSRSPYFSRSKSPQSPRSKSSYFSRPPHSTRSSYYSRSRSPHSPRSQPPHHSRSRSPHSQRSRPSHHSRSRSPHLPRSRSPDSTKKSPHSDGRFDHSKASSSALQRVTNSKKVYANTAKVHRRSSHSGSRDENPSIDGRMSKTSNNTGRSKLVCHIHLRYNTRSSQDLLVFPSSWLQSIGWTLVYNGPYCPDTIILFLGATIPDTKWKRNKK